jgi:glycosyltransferase domain-containing protein
MEPSNVSGKLTIILTLKDRVSFTYRWMQYMNDIACAYPIIVADGGVDLVLEEYLKDYENYPKLNYTYIRYPFDNDLNTFYRKIVDAIDKVTTPYLLFADNDDFFLVEPIEDFIKFLDYNSDFVSCGGSNISLTLLSENNTVLNAAKAKKYIATSSNVNRSVNMEDGISRFFYFMENANKNELWNSWYQVQRTSCIKKSFAFLRI